MSEIISELEGGYIAATGQNELEVVSTIEDPPKLRLAAPFPSLSLGCISWNRRRTDGGQEEVALLQGKVDERYRNDPNNLYAEITLHMRNGAIADADRAMIPILTWRHDGVTFHVPVYGPGSPSNPEPPIVEPPPVDPPPTDYVLLHGNYVIEQYNIWLGRNPDPVELFSDSENVHKYGEEWLVENLKERSGQ